MKNIRNFVIIAHIDHGKSTLADRFLELTGAVAARKMRAQFLDMHPLERERGITIKMQPVRMIYRPKFPISHSQFSMTNFQILNIENSMKIAKLKIENSDSEFILNLIDTPGHADFSYEVSRSLAAVEGAILLVDATQGVQAQTLANLHAAQDLGLVIIPVINKIDLPLAEVGKAEEEMMRLLGIAAAEIYKISAKEGTGVADLLRAVAEKIPPPRGAFKYLNIETFKQPPLRALVFDSKYDPYLGVVAHIRMVDGAIKKGERIFFMASGADAEALEVGVFLPERSESAGLSAGEIGYVATGLKRPAAVRVGDTITRAGTFKYFSPKANPPLAENVETSRPIALPGYREPAPMVFCSFFPGDQQEYEALRDGLGKLKLEDAALSFAPEDAGALGRGFRAGFLGLLHMEIIAERIRREYAVRLVLTRPSVAFRVITRAGSDSLVVYSASRLPPASDIASIEEPWVRAEAIAPAAYLGALTGLISETGGSIGDTETLAADRLLVSFEAPLRAVIIDFYDKLKSISHGYASFSYEPIGYRPGDLARLDIIIADESQPSLAEIVPRDAAYGIGRSRLAALKELLPAELFAIALQAAVGGRIIARETIPAVKKDVTSHMYGGDRTRKIKLWKKQQKGKKRLREIGRVKIPPEIFFKLHRREDS